ncbi:MAG: sugar nucleotide-binding protein [Acidobacteriales bacterium]|nr:sugar nucleotide-binding protein [Terriglobales bacterium]
MQQVAGRSRLQLWGGVECTINRVNDIYIEQLERSGHTRRLSDFEEFATLGITALRHPLLWEHTAPDGLENADWRWADASLQRLKGLDIPPIVGLLHHGSGPRSTDLLDPEFPQKLSAYAAAVAGRYPWVQDYTPVNEPLTTARFSALYGHWYPHRRDDLSFARALLHQCRAIVLCMRAIRNVNPSARLIQTEDVGKAFSTPMLAYQADFENERRWFTYDVLCGTVDRHHRMWQHFVWAGIQQSELEWFLDNPCPPDVIGINHYLSGERYLDEHLRRYPENTHGGNGRHSYADVLAARVLEDGPAGPRALLMEAWDRYRIPIAVTECHNGCTREEQLRWFLEVWRAAEQCRDDGAQILAVTAWSLLGAFDWSNLVTRKDGHYEPGVYDVRFSRPRPTALAGMIRMLSAGQEAEHPVLQVSGWWKRRQRLAYGISINDRGEATERQPGCADDFGRGYFPFARPVVIAGGDGTLGRAFARICQYRGIPYRALSRSELDIAEPKCVQEILDTFRPWAVINAAGYVSVDDAEVHPSACFRENSEGPFILATECDRRNIQLLTFSSDLVFGGPWEGSRPYLEPDIPNPVNCYGMSKAQAEQRVFQVMEDALVVRTSAFFGPWDSHNFVAIALRELEARRQFFAASDITVSPTYVPDLVHACLDLLVDREKGIWHLANVGAVTWSGLAEKAAQVARVSTHSLSPCPLVGLKLRAKRPSYSALSSEKALLLPSLDDALHRFAHEFIFSREQNLVAA